MATALWRASYRHADMSKARATTAGGDTEAESGVSRAEVSEQMAGFAAFKAVGYGHPTERVRFPSTSATATLATCRVALRPSTAWQVN